MCINKYRSFKYDENKLDLTFPKRVADETKYLTTLLSTLADRVQYAVINFKNCKRKDEALAFIDAVMELRFSFHNRRIKWKIRKLMKKSAHMKKDYLNFIKRI